MELTAKELIELTKEIDQKCIDFAEWSSKYSFLPNRGWYTGSLQIEMGIFKTTKERLEIYKKEKGL